MAGELRRVRWKGEKKERGREGDSEEEEKMAEIERYKRRENYREGEYSRGSDVKWWVTREEGSVRQACGQSDGGKRHERQRTKRQCSW